MTVNEDELLFWSDESSSGAVYGNPIRKSADDLLKWFGNEGEKKPFRMRKQVRPRKSTTATVGGLPTARR